MYADDTQLYLSFDFDSACDEIASRSQIKSCIKENKLKLNNEKTELLIITTKYHQSKSITDFLQIGEIGQSSLKSHLFKIAYDLTD